MASFKYIFLFSFMFLSITCIGQVQPDITIPKVQFDSLKRAVGDLKGINMLMGYRLRIAEDLKKIDSVFYRGDSTVFTYLDHADKIIKRIKIGLKGTLLKDSIEMNYNRNGLLEYQVQWSKSDNSMHLRQMYRYEYDQFGRLTKYVLFLSTPVLRISLISYDSEGKRKTIPYKGPIYTFWD